MAFLDKGFHKLYQKKLREGNSLKTDDIIGAKPRRAVRDRDPEAFEKMSRIQGVSGDYDMQSQAQLRPGAKNLDHYHRLMNNLPGGAKKWEDVYSMQKAKGDVVGGLIKHNEQLYNVKQTTPKIGTIAQSPYYRDERSSPPAFQNSSPELRLGGNMKITTMAAERSLDADIGSPSKRFGRPELDGIRPEKLPALPHPTRFRSPQVTRGNDNDMMALMSHMGNSDNATLFPGGRRGRGGIEPTINELRKPSKNVFDSKYSDMKEELEYRREKGLLYRRTSPDNPLQMAAGTRLNRSVDQSSSQPYQDVDYVKNIFDSKEPTSYKLQNPGMNIRASVGMGGQTKGMFLSRKQERKPSGIKTDSQARDDLRGDAQFVKNADLFF